MLHWFYDLKIKHKLIISFSLIIIFIILVVELIFYRASVNTLHDLFGQYSVQLLDKVGNSLDLRLNQLSSLTLSVSENSELNIRRNLGNEEGKLNTVESMQVYGYLRDLAYMDSSVCYAVFVDRSGHQTDYSKEKSKRKLYSADDHLGERKYLETFNGRPVYEASEDGSFFLKQALYSTSSMNYLGYLVVDIDSEYLASIYTDMDIEKLGCIAVLDSKKDIIACDSEETRQIITHLLEAESDITDTRGARALTFEREKYLLNIRNSSKEGMIIVNLLPERSINKNAEGLKLAFIIVALAALFFAVLLATFISGNIGQNISGLLEMVRWMSQGNFNERIAPKSHDEIGNLAREFNFMAKRITELMQQLHDEQENKRKAEYLMLEFQYKALQSNINPHFLYNVLASINSVAILENNLRISQQVCRLANVLRTSIDRKNKETTLLEEVEYLTEYVALYQDILGNKVKVHFSIEPETLEYKVPCFLLQPIVENAIVHGVEPKMEEGEVWISSNMEKDWLVCTVRDSGVGMNETQLQTILNSQAESKEGRGHIGLHNVQERIQLLYGEKYGLEVCSVLDVGTVVIVRLPLHS